MLEQGWWKSDWAVLEMDCRTTHMLEECRYFLCIYLNQSLEYLEMNSQLMFSLQTTVFTLKTMKTALTNFDNR